ncbi:50S ribosomal protein L10, partial [Candidatus Daviesbacteria bacterium]|nr:50S ribosomal protein L10 [Candidatus Daviesbacteria bacterium]
MPKTRQQKEDTVTKLQDKLSKAKALVFADYKGLTMKQLSDLR